MIKYAKPNKIVKWLGYWPPYFFSGISVKEINPEFTRITAQLKQHFFNTNYVGSHFGGSLYSMCDPFFMFILLQHLSKDHIVWDQSAQIEFIRPGKGTVTAIFEISLQQIENLKEQALQSYKLTPSFETCILDSQGNVVAKVKKGLYIRRKDAKQRFANFESKILE